ncbi:MAG: hypothetical protein KAT25_08125 [Sulfuriflexus sp.]|nr:hypothetical protein [Sulfuriflexus sp.]
MLSRFFFVCVLFSSPLVVSAADGEWSGYIATEWRVFLDLPTAPEQHGDNVSLSAQAEYYREWNAGKQSFRFTPFLRIDGRDSQRSHIDIRELNWTMVHDTWEFTAGIAKVFWGVTESQHLVDIINQTDLIESADGEEKLGQSMLKLSLTRDWGDIDLFVLPGFRERTFPSRVGRLRTQTAVAVNNAEYASSQGRDHIDAAIRWSHSLGDWDVGLSHFSGTSRDPRFRAAVDKGRTVVIPIYETIDQTGVDLQATKDDWLWKLEVISRSGQGERYTAATGGFEYSLYGINESAVDLGLIVEYLFDDRDELALTPFEDDLFLGARLAFNDEASSELLAGMIVDLENGSRVMSVEASRRIGDDWKVNLEARFFSNIASQDSLLNFENDDFVQMELAWYF